HSSLPTVHSLTHPSIIHPPSSDEQTKRPENHSLCSPQVKGPEAGRRGGRAGDPGAGSPSLVELLLPYEYKIVIAGNHELTFDQEFMADLIKQDFYYFPSVSKLKPENYENVQSLLTNCIYLQDSEVTVRGFRIYGSPCCDLVCLDPVTALPLSPLPGFLDWVPKKMQRVGCVELLNTVQRRVQPRLHVFGHIHEACLPVHISMAWHTAGA
ncbi:hypothetical protein FD755_000248, partial [Muntiacus reevesi]